MFNCYLHILAEITRFGDRLNIKKLQSFFFIFLINFRRFFNQWWNAGDIATYWRDWNAPVHNWLKRHIYFPLKEKGCYTSTSTGVSQKKYHFRNG